MKSRLIFIFLFSIQVQIAFTQSKTFNNIDSSFKVYPLVEYGYNHNNEYKNPWLYRIHNVNAGVGISYRDIRFELAYPFLQSYDSIRFFRNTISVSIGYSFKSTDPDFRVVPRINFLRYQIADHLVEYDHGAPNVNVPIRYLEKVNIRRLTYTFGVERRMVNSLFIGFDFGLSIFKVEGKKYSEVDGTEGSYRHEMDHPDSPIDLVKLFLGIRLSYFLN